MNTNNNSFFKYLLIFVVGFISFYLLQNFTNFVDLSFLEQKTSTITVHGSAQQDVVNQVAEFTAGIEVIASEKEEALNSATTIMNQLLADLDNFGIEKKDLQTSQVSVYQEEEIQPYLETNSETNFVTNDETLNNRKGDWRANLSINITLRGESGDQLKNKSEELLSLLNSSQANYVYGPNFRLDNENLAEIDLINAAVADARNKAEAIAASNQQKIKKVLEIIEDDANYQPFYRGELAVDQVGLTSPSLEPGSSTLYKTVIVTFQVK